MNNVNNYRVPGQDNVTGDLPDAGSGLSARKQFGLEYRYEGKPNARTRKGPKKTIANKKK